MILFFNAKEKAIAFMIEESQWWMSLLESAQSNRDALVDRIRSDAIAKRNASIFQRLSGKKLADVLADPDERAASTLKFYAPQGHKDHYILSNFCQLVETSVNALVTYGKKIRALRDVDCDGAIVPRIERVE